MLVQESGFLGEIKTFNRVLGIRAIRKTSVFAPAVARHLAALIQICGYPSCLIQLPGIVNQVILLHKVKAVCQIVDVGAILVTFFGARAPTGAAGNGGLGKLLCAFNFLI